MRIVAINKTLNEERFIKRYCQNHAFCDLILVADGGSTDRTVKLAKIFDNVLIRNFTKRKTLPDGSFMNPEPAHVNFLLDWADEEKADWIIFTGCDTWPNLALQARAREFLEEADQGMLAYQLYLWGENQYFPKINEAGQALWAWRADLGLRCDESGDSFFDTVMPGPDLKHCLKLGEPYVLMHYFSDPEREEMKLKRYAAWGYPKTHIMSSMYAPPEPLPEWAREWQV